MKKFLFSLVATAMMLTSVVANAQDTRNSQRWKPYGFVQLQGGIGTTFTNYRAGKLISPTATVGVGYMPIPELGLRYNINGAWSKGGLKSIDEKYKYNYVMNDFDVLFNLTNIFSKNKVHAFDLYLVTGIGIDYAWNNDIASLNLAGVTEDISNKWGDGLAQKDFWGTNFRIGLMGDYNINRHWSIGAEVDMNPITDDFNSKLNGGKNRDWMLTAQVSLTYKFGNADKSVVKEPVVRPVKEKKPKVVKTKVRLTDKNYEGQGNYRIAEYETTSSESSKRMLDNLARQIKEECGPYIEEGGRVDIIFTGSADAIPVNGRIKYNGEDVHDLPVSVQGIPMTMTITKESGIRTNEQLALARALKAMEYVYKSTPALYSMKTANYFNAKVSDERGIEYRTVDVEFIFYGK